MFVEVDFCSGFLGLGVGTRLSIEQRLDDRGVTFHAGIAQRRPSGTWNGRDRTGAQMKGLRHFETWVGWVRVYSPFSLRATVDLSRS